MVIAPEHVAQLGPAAAELAGACARRRSRRSAASGESMIARRRPGAGAEHEDAVGEQQRLVDAEWVTNITVAPVRDQMLQEILLQLLARLRVQRAERLIHEDENGLAHQRARDPDALLHAAGELMRIVLGKSGKPDKIDEVARAARARSAPPTPSISSGNSTLPMTVRQGSRPKFWNTMQASLRGAVTGVSGDGDAAFVRA